MAIYIHIPFCKRRCVYCDFYFVTSSENTDRFVYAVIEEIISKKGLLTDEVKTIYFGGGTPSLLYADALSRILNAVSQSFSLNSSLEITLEANPEHITEPYLQDIKLVGINRLSLGVQSFSDAKLSRLTRHHSAVDSITSVEKALCIIGNVNVDLMFGESSETLNEWAMDVEQLINLSPPHVSTYGLTVEPKTPLERAIRLNKIPALNETVQAEAFLHAMEKLEQAGYEHYEVSNFAKTKMNVSIQCESNRSLHNQHYWNRVPYLGFGPSAHSFLLCPNQKRFSNKRDLMAYIQNPINAYDFEEVLSSENVRNETIMLGLRQNKGINLDELQEQYKPSVWGLDNANGGVQVQPPNAMSSVTNVQNQINNAQKSPNYESYANLALDYFPLMRDSLHTSINLGFFQLDGGLGTVWFDNQQYYEIALRPVFLHFGNLDLG
ncbi:hypothetical protein CHS0354_000600 [Potamilus streckersoni]|uniref:Radical S-adenosyl methionine domain-containing protein 1, mitochondrial n=1 Tax=Potamilus streckersoni TaxID=2493646 RepID=A0AAE0W829_9BIVA|nr:hypothetical protein CHS0354_000600 [Potamilus streckersoni]